MINGQVSDVEGHTIPEMFLQTLVEIFEKQHATVLVAFYDNTNHYYGDSRASTDHDDQPT